jgi:hypothetical protein
MWHLPPTIITLQVVMSYDIHCPSSVLFVGKAASSTHPRSPLFFPLSSSHLQHQWRCHCPILTKYLLYIDNMFSRRALLSIPTVLSSSRNFSSTPQVKADFTHAVIGAGAVGLAIARRLQQVPGAQVVLIEKHNMVGSETSSRNSEVGTCSLSPTSAASEISSFPPGHSRRSLLRPR